MNQAEIDILNLENKILQDRQILNNLIYQYESNGMKKEMIDAKLVNLQTELDYMSRQLDMLMKEYRSSREVAYVKDAMPVLNDNLVRENKEIPVMPVKQEQRQAIHNQALQTQMEQKRTATVVPKKDLESVVGKLWMGAIASVLIFISIIMFATLLLPVLTDTLKMIAMFVVSFGVTIVGLVKLKKNPDSPFYLALSGCGIGSIYISILLSNMYFKMTNDIVVYVLILIWTLFVCYLSRKGSVLFQIIGQSGILIAVIFGISLCTINDDTAKLLFLTVFFIITSSVFMFSHLKKPLSGNMINFWYTYLSVSLLVLGISGVQETIEADIIAALLVFYIAIMVVVAFKRELDKPIVLGALTTLYFINLFFCLGRFFETDTARSSVMLFVSVVILVLSEWKCGERISSDKITLQVPQLLFVLFFTGILDIGTAQIRLFVLAYTFLVGGYWRRNRIFQYASLVYVFLFVCSDIGILGFVLGITYFITSFACSYIMKEQYCVNVKIGSYLLFLFFLLGCDDLLEDLYLSYESVESLMFLAISAINLFALKGIGTKSFVTGEREKVCETICNVINGFLMLFVVSHIQDLDSVLWHFVCVIMAGTLFMANSSNLIKKYKGTKWELPVGIYVGIKLTILLITVLSSFEAANIIISVACFVFAIAWIIIGFWKDTKSLRIYGLILSLFSVIKLIMIDINYDNLLGRAAGFFGCGVLCFIISFIYSTIDKKMKSE